ncbi:phosphonate transport system substrate-binding protein [Rhodoblastus acidophilus]|uniref:Phosphonate transport system substrate-binding protein n=1 Tax=Rhodoblastus acidophilus TaxID=1074 RepID=A0A212RBK0_RHOAC|nr:phosphate/phosphite/phosphonate ABC transporter substrate-binding protein [Rhodoblastus acidophilus]PPQ39412.1 phosphate/phosphite/phosphonate ABC transporter substrate-binding protein [Rhodoblastus acidophilus]RAI16274.1 phosphate/phosphite/phosphonate ABC transporter substrate-binding protein [Rhodoblastus acidophilus]SNB69626.1 phosphonate transport system substrate-binding protein [Rhodoblastus acidophilus]
MLNFSRRLACAALAAALAGPALAQPAAPDAARPQKLVIGLLPTESAPTVMRLNEPLRAYLEARLKMPVEVVVGANYAATSEALRFGRLDIAYLGPVTYILQSQHAGLEPFARPSHAGVGPTFQATIIVPAASKAQSLADLKGGEIAFGDPASTSGTWAPRWQLLHEGLISGRDYTLRVLGAHDAVALAVANGKVAAGGLSKPILNRLIKEGKIDPAKVRVLQDSPPIPEYIWTFRAGLDPAFKEDVRKAFLEIKDPAALGVFRAEAFIPAVDADVDRVRNWIAAIQTVSAQTAWTPAP